MARHLANWISNDPHMMRINNKTNKYEPVPDPAIAIDDILTNTLTGMDLWYSQCERLAAFELAFAHLYASTEALMADMAALIGKRSPDTAYLYRDVGVMIGADLYDPALTREFYYGAVRLEGRTGEGLDALATYQSVKATPKARETAFVKLMSGRSRSEWRPFVTREVNGRHVTQGTTPEGKPVVTITLVGVDARQWVGGRFKVKLWRPNS
jgi:hypothetical protein